MHWISVRFYEMGDILLRLAELYAEFRWGPTPASFDFLCKSESVRNVWKLWIRRKNLIRSLFFISDFFSPPPRMSPFENPKFWLMLNVQSSHKKNVCRVKLYTFQSSWVSFIPLAPSKRAHHLHCFSLPGLQKPRRNHFTKKFLLND